MPPSARTMDQAFAGMEYSGVAAVHTRNEAGEIHYHLHVLVGKFARERDSGRVFSLNSKRGGNSVGRIQVMKRAWKEHVDRQFRSRLGLNIQQGRAYARPTLTLEDGTSIPPLNRQSRRLLDKQLSPQYSSTSDAGFVKHHSFRWTALDERIFEIAAAPKEAGRWSAQVFCELFPEHARKVGAYHARVETLKRIGYLTPEGAITPSFHLHYAARHGIDTPELQRLRADVGKRETRRAAKENRPPALDDLWLKLHHHYELQKRAERLGFNQQDLARIAKEAERHKPTPQTLRALRAKVERQIIVNPRAKLPETKTIVRAYWGVQKAKVRAIFLDRRGSPHPALPGQQAPGREIQRAARIDLFYAKEKRLAQLGRLFQPVFWASRIVLPRETRRLEKAISRCAELTARQEVDAVYREQVEARLSRLARPVRRPATRPAAGESPAPRAAGAGPGAPPNRGGEGSHPARSTVSLSPSNQEGHRESSACSGLRTRRTFADGPAVKRSSSAR